jgi:hypothetical protein
MGAGGSEENSLDATGEPGEVKMDDSSDLQLAMGAMQGVNKAAKYDEESSSGVQKEEADTE